VSSAPARGSSVVAISTRFYGRASITSCRRGAVPIPLFVEKLVALVICAVVAVPSSTSPLRDASRLSGFRVRHAVATTSLSARQYAALVSHASAAQVSSRAWYDVARHRLFVQRRPRPGRRALIHEYVRALIDQNFHLRRIARWRTRDRDRWDAAQGM